MGFLEGAPLELLLVFIIALIVLGPEGLPDFARKVGHVIREARRMVGEVTREFQQEFDSLDQARDEVKRLAALPSETVKSALAPLPKVGAGSADGSADPDERDIDPSALYYGATVEPASQSSQKTEIETALEASGRRVAPPEFAPDYIAPDAVNDFAATAATPPAPLPLYQPQFGSPLETTVVDAHDMADDIYVEDSVFYPTPAPRDFDMPDDDDDTPAANTHADLSDFAKGMMQQSRVARPIEPQAAASAPRKMRIAGRHGVQGRTTRREEQPQ